MQKTITKLRISAHNLMIETGRYKRPNKVPLENRVCDLCGTIENEIHFVMQVAGLEVYGSHLESVLQAKIWMKMKMKNSYL